jgi:DNA polymerase III alpha subunit
MEPGDSVLSPRDIIRHCMDKGFPGCAIIGGSRLLALNEVMHTMEHLGLGSRGGFKVILGIEINLFIGHVQMECVVLARNRAGWAFLRDICTRPLAASGVLAMGLGTLSEQRGNVFPAYRPFSAKTRSL